VNGTVIHAAGDADNVVSLLDLGTGQLLARRSFDPLPGRADALQGAAWLDTGVQAVPVVVAMIDYPRGVLEVPVQLTGGQNRVYPFYVQDDAAVGVAPGILSGTYLTLQEAGLHVEVGNYDDHTVDYVEDEGGFFDVGHAVQLGTDGPADYHVGTWDGFVTLPYDGSAPVLSPIAEGNFVSLGVLWGSDAASNRIFGAVNQWGSGDYTVRAWSAADAAAGDAATSTWTAPGPLDGAAVMDGTLWAFYWDGTTDHAVELTRDLEEVRDIAMNDFLYQIIAVSPNGRTFVSRENQPFSEDTSIVVWSNDPDGSFPRAATIPIGGQVAGAVFDPTGEALYVMMRNPGRIVVLQ
jgi:hypothetical protein